MSNMNGGRRKKNKAKGTENIYNRITEENLPIFKAGWPSRFKKHAENKIDWTRKESLFRI